MGIIIGIISFLITVVGIVLVNKSAKKVYYIRDHSVVKAEAKKTAATLDNTEIVAFKQKRKR